MHAEPATDTSRSNRGLGSPIQPVFALALLGLHYRIVFQGRATDYTYVVTEVTPSCHSERRAKPAVEGPSARNDTV
jgi:hypothetical protein